MEFSFSHIDSPLFIMVMDIDVLVASWGWMFILQGDLSGMLNNKFDRI
jgi:hypothetical protein